MHNDLLWAVALMAATGLLGFAVTQLTAWRASKSAAAHPALLRLSGMALDVANGALAWLSANPQATPQMAAQWALAELKASAPGLITEAGDDASDAGLRYLVNRKLVTAAQSMTASTTTAAIIQALAPSAVTARVTPPQFAAAAVAAESLAPITEEALRSFMVKTFPALSAAVAVPTADVPATPPPAAATSPPG